MAFTPNTLFITPAEVIAIAIPDVSFDEALVPLAIIRECQFEHLHASLTKEFYEELEKGIRLESLNPKNTLLLDEYLKPAIAFFVKAKIAPDVAFKMTTAGMTRNVTEYSSAASKADVDYIRTHAISSGESWKQRALNYLRDNGADFPTYKDATCRRSEGVSALSYGIVINTRKRR